MFEMTHQSTGPRLLNPQPDWTQKTVYDELLRKGRQEFAEAGNAQLTILRTAMRRSVHMSVDDYLVAWANLGCTYDEVTLDHARYISEQELAVFQKRAVVDPDTGYRIEYRHPAAGQYEERQVIPPSPPKPKKDFRFRTNQVTTNRKTYAGMTT